MTETNKPVKGQEFLNRVASKLTGEKTAEHPAEDYETKTRRVESQAVYHETVERLNNPPSVRELQAQQLTQEREDKRAAEKRAQDLEDERVKKLDDERQAAAMAADEERQKREEMERKLQAQRDEMLLGKLKELQASQKPLTEQVKEFFTFARESAETLGYTKPDGVTKPSSDNPELALEIVKLNLTAQREQREFEWKMEQDRRQWDLKLVEMKDNREFKKEELALKAKKDDMIANFPKFLGTAIAEGLMARGGGTVTEAAQSAQSISREIPQSQAKQALPEIISITAGVGEAGEIACPKCGTKVGIAPTTQATACVSCQQKFSVRREEAQPADAEPPPAQEKPKTPLWP